MTNQFLQRFQLLIGLGQEVLLIFPLSERDQSPWFVALFERFFRDFSFPLEYCFNLQKPNSETTRQERSPIECVA